MRSSHCTEQQLELFAAFPEDLNELEYALISQHLCECKLYEEHLVTLRRFYSDMELRQQQKPSEKDRFCANLLCANGFSILDFRNFRWN
jgi:hypothetical protein